MTRWSRGRGLLSADERRARPLASLPSVDVPQPMSTVPGESEPPCLVGLDDSPSSDAVVAEWTGAIRGRLPRGLPPLTTSYPGGPRRVSPLIAGVWVDWWADHGFSASTHGWVLYRWWAPLGHDLYEPGTLRPSRVVFEFPAVSRVGRRRVRAVVDPLALIISSLEAVTRAESRLCSPAVDNSLAEAESQLGAHGFSARLRAYRRNRALLDSHPGSVRERGTT